MQLAGSLCTDAGSESTALFIVTEFYNLPQKVWLWEKDIYLKIDYSIPKELGKVMSVLNLSGKQRQRHRMVWGWPAGSKAQFLKVSFSTGKFTSERKPVLIGYCSVSVSLFYNPLRPLSRGPQAMPTHPYSKHCAASKPLQVGSHEKPFMTPLSL